MRSIYFAGHALTILQSFVALFLAILFLQSGADKIFDREGNLQWLKGHFAKSILGSMVSVLLSVITLLELAAGLLSGIGCILLAFHQGSTVAYAGAVLSAMAIIALFFGQRMAKDYPGAGSLVPYFLLTLVAIYLLAPLHAN